MKKFLLLLGCLLLVGCNLGDVPPAHKGWVFEQSQTGSSRGFIGDMLGPGTHELGTVKKVDEQIKTEQKQKQLAQVKAEKAGTEIEQIGKMIRDNPQYLEYLKVQNDTLAIEKAPAAFEGLGKGGGTIVFGTSGSPLNMMLTGAKAAK